MKPIIGRDAQSGNTVSEKSVQKPNESGEIA